MKKLLCTIREKWDTLKVRVKSSLEALSPEARLNVVMILMAIYLIATFYFLAQVIIERNEEALDIKHIQPADRLYTPPTDSIPHIEESDTVSSLHQNH